MYGQTCTNLLMVESSLSQSDKYVSNARCGCIQHLTVSKEMLIAGSNWTNTMAESYQLTHWTPMCFQLSQNMCYSHNKAGFSTYCQNIEGYNKAISDLSTSSST